MIVDERVDAFLDSLEAELPEYLRRIEKDALCDEVPIIRKQTQSLLCFLLQVKKPRRILEIGAAVGFSALLMAENSGSDTKITTIEKVPARIQKAKENFAGCEISKKITLIEGDAVEILREMAMKEVGGYDFIFMDAAKGQYQLFYEAAKKLLARDGMLVSDNVLQEGEVAQSRYAVTRRDRTIHGRMREYLYQLKTEEDVKSVILPVGDGVVLTVRK